MKVAILTDSGANLSLEFMDANPNLFVLPLIINVDGKGFRDQVELDANSVYEKIDTHNISTSLPDSGDLLKVLNKIVAEGYSDVLAINISSGLSGTFNAFRLVFEDFVGLNITHYDSKTLGYGLGMLVEEALLALKSKTDIPTIIKQLDKMRYEDSVAMYTINTLKYLRKGGRIGKVEGTIADIVNIKPVITVNNEGVYVTIAKPFGMKRALLAMKNILVDKFGANLIDLVVHYGNNPVHALELGEKLRAFLKIRNLSISQLTPVLGVHTGPDMFAYVAHRVTTA